MTAGVRPHIYESNDNGNSVTGIKWMILWRFERLWIEERQCFDLGWAMQVLTWKLKL